MDHLYSLFDKHPDLKKTMEEKIKEYDDSLKIFFEHILSQIEYFDNIPESIMNEIIFSFVPEQHEKGSSILRIDEESDRMIIIQNGMVEMHTAMDNGVDFVIERLYRGSVINSKSFILRDKINVGARCATPVSLYYLTLDKLNGKSISPSITLS